MSHSYYSSQAPSSLRNTLAEPATIVKQGGQTLLAASKATSNPSVASRSVEDTRMMNTVTDAGVSSPHWLTVILQLYRRVRNVIEMETVVNKIFGDNSHKLAAIGELTEHMDKVGHWARRGRISVTPVILML